MSRQTILLLLVAANLVLLTAIVLSAYSPPAAWAQGTGRSGDYILVSGRAQASRDVVYLFDLRNRLLHVFAAVPGRPVNVAHMDTRDLTRDFGPR